MMFESANCTWSFNPNNRHASKTGHAAEVLAQAGKSFIHFTYMYRLTLLLPKSRRQNFRLQTFKNVKSRLYRIENSKTKG